MVLWDICICKLEINHENFLGKNVCKKLQHWKWTFRRTENDFLNIDNLQSMFLCSKKIESRNNHFHTCIKSILKFGYVQKVMFGVPLKKFIFHTQKFKNHEFFYTWTQLMARPQICKDNYCISANSFRGKYFFLKFGLMYCDST